MNLVPSRVEECIDHLLLLPHWQFAALERVARSEQRTIGRVIRQLIGLYLAGGCARGAPDRGWGEFRIDPAQESSGVIELSLLLPAAQLAELEVRASRRNATTGEFIRHLICDSFFAPGADERARRTSEPLSDI